MKKGILAGSLVLVLVGCAKRPPELQRAEKLDPECAGRGGAFTYSITSGTAIMEKAVKTGCTAPVGAWTDESDAAKGGTRTLAHDLREKEQQTFLCCKL